MLNNSTCKGPKSARSHLPLIRIHTVLIISEAPCPENKKKTFNFFWMDKYISNKINTRQNLFLAWSLKSQSTMEIQIRMWETSSSRPQGRMPGIDDGEEAGRELLHQLVEAARRQVHRRQGVNFNNILWPDFLVWKCFCGFSQPRVWLCNFL